MKNYTNRKGQEIVIFDAYNLGQNLHDIQRSIEVLKDIQEKLEGEQLDGDPFISQSADRINQVIFGLEKVETTISQMKYMENWKPKGW